MFDTRTLYQIFFEINMGLCERFPSLDPFMVRKKPAYEVFSIVGRLNIYTARQNKLNKKKGKGPVTRKHAGDSWF